MRNNGSNLDDVASISKSLEESNLPLQDCLDDKSIWFLSLCGVYGRKETLLLTYSLVCCGYTPSIYFLYGLRTYSSCSKFLGLRIQFNSILLLLASIALQGIATIFIVVHTRGRMHQLVNKIDLFVFPESRRVALICLFVFFVTYVPIPSFTNCPESILSCLSFFFEPLNKFRYFVG
jgi:hypothetical protein